MWVFAVIDGTEFRDPLIDVNENGVVQELSTSSSAGVAAMAPPPVAVEKVCDSVDVSAMDPLPCNLNFEKVDLLNTNQSTSSDVMGNLLEMDSYDVDKTLFRLKLSVSSLSSENDDFEKLVVQKSDFKKQQEELHMRLQRLESLVKVQKVEAKKKMRNRSARFFVIRLPELQSDKQKEERGQRESV